MANSNVKDVLTNFVKLEEKEDGQVKGSFGKLSKKDFSSGEVYDMYKLELVYAVRLINDALATEDKDERARLLNVARENHIASAYKMLEKECLISGIELPEYGFTVSKRHIRAWIQVGGLTRLVKDFKTCQRHRKDRSWSYLAKFVESDVADIIAGRVRLGDDNIERNKTNENAIERKAKAEEKKKAKAEAEAKKAEEKAEEITLASVLETAFPDPEERKAMIEAGILE